MQMYKNRLHIYIISLPIIIVNFDSKVNFTNTTRPKLNAQKIE